MNIENEHSIEQSTAMLIDWLRETGSATGEFARGQAPELVREIVVFGWASTGMFAAMSLVALCFILWGLRQVCSNKAESDDDMESQRFMIGMVVGLVSICAFVFILPGCYHGLKKAVSPRVYIVERILERK